MITSINSIRMSLETAHGILDSVVGDLTQEAATHTFPGTRMNPIAPTLAHAVYDEDFMVNKLVMGADPLLTRDGWLARTGIPDENPTLSPELLAAKLDLGALREYAAAVFAEVDRALAGLSAEDMERSIPPPFGNGVRVSEFLARFVANHTSAHSGEISALKGALGLPGFPG
jgi:hypothetical protein